MRYYYYIKSICNERDSSIWSNQANFATQCQPVSHFPYYEDFESYGSGQDGGLNNPFPTCWTRKQTMSTTIGYPYLETKAVYKNGNASLFFQAGRSTYCIASLPEMQIDDIGKLKIEFLGATANMNHSIELGIMTVPSDESTFVSLKQFTVDRVDSKKQFSAYLNKYKGEGRFISFKTTKSSQFYIDDVRVSMIGSCIPPHDMTVNDISSNGALLSWTRENNEDSYHIKISSFPLNHPEYMNANILDTIISSDELALNNLSASQLYYIYSTSNCSDSVSEWS